MKIPFFPNTGDGTHCFQAAMRMALAVLAPEREFTYDELDLISRKLPGKWTWPTAAMLWMLDNGFGVELVENFDYSRFAAEGGDYLISRYGEEVGRAQIENSDVRCSHASTVSPVDPDQRFYLHSRGVPPTVADRLIVAGFFHDVIVRMPTAIHDVIRRLVAAKLDARVLGDEVAQ